MQCTSCGALQETGVPCPVCEAFVNDTISGSLGLTETPSRASTDGENNPQTSKLIEFPGVSRNPVPPWRKELSERVREVQEKRAREAALVVAERGSSAQEEAPGMSPQLELLRHADVAPLNPLVSAALRRIERAHHSSAQSVNRIASAPGNAALAYAADNEYRVEAPPEFEIGVSVASDIELQNSNDSPPSTEPAQPERVHNLVVVPLKSQKRRAGESNLSRDG